MSKQAKFYLGRVRKRGELTVEKIVEAMREPATIFKASVHRDRKRGFTQRSLSIGSLAQWRWSERTSTHRLQLRCPI